MEHAFNAINKNIDRGIIWFIFHRLLYIRITERLQLHHIVYCGDFYKFLAFDVYIISFSNYIAKN